MDRLAAGVLIAGVVLAMNAGMLREALADATRGEEEQTASGPVSAVAGDTRSSRIMSLLLCLEALRSAPGLIEEDEA